MGVETVKVNSKGQITIPKKIREKEEISEGDQLLVQEKEGRIVIEKAELDKWIEAKERIRESMEEKEVEPLTLAQAVEEIHEMKEDEKDKDSG
ncbi:MAG: AbrB/MazE/SpoVT family DNA-binding domain-containing protein [Candidatus Nanohaloarchaeota archaeon QJJ-9]|nr:AbrB/MazE/SpoVT family DNA-binding domain-containing protein [Candidatus Nanohaloarchaeota archaeon QJJ-9]